MVQVTWQGEKAGSDPEWGSGRFLAMTIRNGHDGNALFVAWNCKHEAAVVDLPPVRAAMHAVYSSMQPLTHRTRCHVPCSLHTHANTLCRCRHKICK